MTDGTTQGTDAHDREYRGAVEGMAETYGPQSHAIGDYIAFRMPDGLTYRGTIVRVLNDAIPVYAVRMHRPGHLTVTVPVDGLAIVNG